MRQGSAGPSRAGQLFSRLGQRLYVRLWLAVLAAVAVLAFLVGWAWRLAADPPLREAIVRDVTGQVVGKGLLRRPHPRGLAAPRTTGAAPVEPPSTQSDGGAETHSRGPAASPDDDDEEGARPGRRPGPEFVVTMEDGRELTIHLPRPRRHFWNRAPYGFFWTLGLVAVAVALSTYPIIRKLTRRLERLQQGVEQWGRGDLTARVPVQGNDEIAFLARRFNHAAERVEALVQSHKSLLANASHELRSPLTRIRMGLELMGPAQGAAAALHSAGAQATDRDAGAMRAEISRNILELDQLIDEILLASRLDAREADLGTAEPVDMAGLAAEECARVGAELEMTGSASSQGELLVDGVAKLLRRAVRNLLENARRYGGGADITAMVRREGRQVVLRVYDRGPGVPIDQRERIFEPFYRLPGASERNGGVGLGLALVKSIAERHRGTVRCEERPGGGAVFALSLPVDGAAG